MTFLQKQTLCFEIIQEWTYPGFVYHIFVYVNQAVNGTFPATRKQTSSVRTRLHWKARGLNRSPRTQAHTHLISKDGRWGRKSFPTKKHMKTQSSMLLSTSNVNGRLAMVSSLSKYCDQKEMLSLKPSNGSWLIISAPMPMVTATYLTENAETKEDKLSFCRSKAVCQFIVLQERGWRLNISTPNLQPNK